MLLRSDGDGQELIVELAAGSRGEDELLLDYDLPAQWCSKEDAAVSSFLQDLEADQLSCSGGRRAHPKNATACQ
jgi:hypothetical protein